jgi:hypothetical protein
VERNINIDHFDEEFSTFLSQGVIIDPSFLMTSDRFDSLLRYLKEFQVRAIHVPSILLRFLEHASESPQKISEIIKGTYKKGKSEVKEIALIQSWIITERYPYPLKRKCEEASKVAYKIKQFYDLLYEFHAEIVEFETTLSIDELSQKIDHRARELKVGIVTFSRTLIRLMKKAGHVVIELGRKITKAIDQAKDKLKDKDNKAIRRFLIIMKNFPMAYVILGPTGIVIDAAKRTAVDIVLDP